MPAIGSAIDEQLRPPACTSSRKAIYQRLCLLSRATRAPTRIAQIGAHELLRSRPEPDRAHSITNFMLACEFRTGCDLVFSLASKCTTAECRFHFTMATESRLSTGRQPAAQTRPVDPSPTARANVARYATTSYNWPPSTILMQYAAYSGHAHTLGAEGIAASFGVIKRLAPSTAFDSQS